MSGSWLGPRSLDGGVDEIPLPGPGRLWLCGKHLVGPDPEAALRRVDGHAVVCLVERHEVDARYPAYVEWLQMQPPGRAVWWPVPDLHAPPVPEARALVRTVAALLDDGRTVLAHCGAGIGRAGTLAVALLLHRGVPLPEAEALVAQHRPTAGPEVGAQRALVQALAADPTGGPGPVTGVDG